METPITNVVIVNSPNNCPNGYKILLNCNCGHPANVWQKMLGAKPEERYLCYTREESEDGKVVADMYIPGKSEKFIIKGYEVIKKTKEGLDSLNHRYLAYQRLDKAKCTKAVFDITIFKSGDSPPSTYKKLGAKLNGVYICVKIANYDSTLHKPRPQSDQRETKPVSPPPDVPRTDTRPQWPHPSDINPTDTAPRPSDVQPGTNAKPHWPSYTEVLPKTNDKLQWPHLSQLNQLNNPNTYPSYNPTPPTSYPGAPPTSYYGGMPSYPYPSTLGQPSYGSSTITPTAPYAPPTGGVAYGSGDNPPEDYITTLGFDHLDMDQPIPDHFMDLEDSPPDSPEPVNEHVDLEITRPLDSLNIDQQQQQPLYQAPPTNNMYYPSNTMGYGTQPAYYGPPGTYPPTNPPGQFGGSGYYPGPPSSGYPPQQPPQQDYSSAIGFKF